MFEYLLRHPADEHSCDHPFSMLPRLMVNHICAGRLLVGDHTGRQRAAHGRPKEVPQRTQARRRLRTQQGLEIWRVSMPLCAPIFKSLRRLSLAMYLNTRQHEESVREFDKIGP